jgi:hypothetical protein
VVAGTKGHAVLPSSPRRRGSRLRGRIARSLDSRLRGNDELTTQHSGGPPMNGCAPRRAVAAAGLWVESVTCYLYWVCVLMFSVPASLAPAADRASGGSAGRVNLLPKGCERSNGASSDTPTRGAGRAHPGHRPGVLSSGPHVGQSADRENRAPHQSRHVRHNRSPALRRPRRGMSPTLSQDSIDGPFPPHSFSPEADFAIVFD